MSKEVRELVRSAKDRGWTFEWARRGGSHGFLRKGPRKVTICTSQRAPHNIRNMRAQLRREGVIE